MQAIGEDFLATLEKRYLIKTPHPSLRATFPHRGRLIYNFAQIFLTSCVDYHKSKYMQYKKLILR